MSFCSSIGANGATSSIRTRAASGVLAAGLIVFAVAVCAFGPGSGWLAGAFAVGPDLALFAGMSSGLQKGQLAPRAVPLYNAFHLYLGPVALAAAIAGGLISQAWLGAALAWGAHVALDRAVGYGLRGRDGLQRG
jgi:Domain of unknown function (DUF4260)